MRRRIKAQNYAMRYAWLFSVTHIMRGYAHIRHIMQAYYASILCLICVYMRILRINIAYTHNMRMRLRIIDKA